MTENKTLKEATDGILNHGKSNFINNFINNGIYKKAKLEAIKYNKKKEEKKLTENQRSEYYGKISTRNEKYKNVFLSMRPFERDAYIALPTKKEKDEMMENFLKEPLFAEKEIEKKETPEKKETESYIELLSNKGKQTSLSTLFNSIVSEIKDNNSVNIKHNKNVCFDINNFSNLINLSIKILLFILIIFLLIISIFSILNFLLISYYIINDKINIFYNKDYLLRYANSYKIIADMINLNSVYLFIFLTEQLVYNNFIIIIIILFIIIISYFYVFLKKSLCDSDKLETFGKLIIDIKCLLILFILFLFLLSHYLLFKFFFIYIINKYSEIFKKQMDMTKQIGKMIGNNIIDTYLSYFSNNIIQYEKINDFLYKKNILNSNELNNYLLVFTIFDYLSNIDNELINNYLADNLNNNFFELLLFKDPPLIKKNYEKLNFFNLDEKKINIKLITDEILILNNKINKINNFIIENNKMSYPSYLVFIYCLIIIFLIAITLLSIYKINDSL